jgi:hypothetical protein
MFDPLRFFLLARKLARGDEASIRTAVNRAYYSSFLVARERLKIPQRGPEILQMPEKL